MAGIRKRQYLASGLVEQQDEDDPAWIPAKPLVIDEGPSSTSLCDTVLGDSSEGPVKAETEMTTVSSSIEVTSKPAQADTAGDPHSPVLQHDPAQPVVPTVYPSPDTQPYSVKSLLRPNHVPIPSPALKSPVPIRPHCAAGVYCTANPWECPMLNVAPMTPPYPYRALGGPQPPPVPVNPWTDPVLLLKLTTLPFPISITRLSDRAKMPTIVSSDKRYFSIVYLYSARLQRIDSKRVRALKTDIRIDFPPGVRAFMETYRGSRSISAQQLYIERTELPTMDNDNLTVNMYNGGPSSYQVAPGDIIAELRFFYCLNVSFKCTTPQPY